MTPEQKALLDKYDTNSIASQEDVEEILDQAQALLAIALQNLTVG